MLSSACFAAVNLIIKILRGQLPEGIGPDILQEVQTFPVHELVLFRSIVSFAICAAIIRYRKIPFFGNNKKWLILRGIFGTTALTLFFFALSNLPMAVATTVQYLSPVFTIVFAIFLQKERVIPVQWIFFLIAFAGVFAISYSPEILESDPKWIIIATISACLSGVAYNAIMKCRTTDAPITVVMYFPLIAIPIMTGACIIFDFIIPRGIDWVLLVAIGILTQIAQVTMTMSFNTGNAAGVAPVKYIGAIYAVLIGTLIFNEDLGFWSSIGIILILSGLLLNTFFKKIFPRVFKQS